MKFLLKTLIVLSLDLLGLQEKTKLNNRKTNII